MLNDDPMTVPARTEPLPPIPIITDTGIKTEKKSGRFVKILSGIAGTALNVAAPGLGSIVGGGSSFGSYAGLIENQKQFEEMQRYNRVANMMQQQQNQAMLDQQQKNSFRLIEMQNRVSLQSQEFSTVSNLLKSRHDSEMTAVNNIKS
ncbi:MAG: hypothetical protein R2684_10775 [Pyrinomonadaceae bacterium]